MIFYIILIIAIIFLIFLIFSIFSVWASRRYVDYRMVEYVKEEGFDVDLPKCKKPRMPKLFRKSLDKQAKYLAVCAQIEGFFAAQGKRKENG